MNSVSYNLKFSASSSYTVSNDLPLLNPTVNLYDKRLDILNQRYSHLLFSLSNRSCLIAQTFMCIINLNKNEINCIFSEYLRIWDKNVDIDHLTVEQVIKLYGYSNLQFINVFFENNEVYHDSFFQFVCIILFCNYKQIITLFLSILKIHSNIFITKSQVENVVSYFDGCILEGDLTQFYQCSEVDLSDYHENVYSVKIFIEFLSNSVLIETLLYSLRISFINQILNKKMYQIIISRQNYYISHPLNILNPPRESCIKYIYRNLFTHDLPPLHFDYILPNPSTRSVDNLILILKMSNGYGFRRTSSGKKQRNSKKSGTNISLSPSVHIQSNSYKPSIRTNSKIVPL